VDDPEAGGNLDAFDFILLMLGLDRTHPFTARSEYLDATLALSHLATEALPGGSRRRASRRSTVER
jgi:hypothetical protein